MALIKFFINFIFSSLMILLLSYSVSPKDSFARELTDKITQSYSAGLKVALIPWIKERLYESSSLNAQYNLLQEQILIVGSQHFELFNEKDLKKHRSDPVAYILGKKMFSIGRYYESTQYLESVRKSGPLYAHAQYILGAISVTERNFIQADIHFKNCSQESEKWQSDYEGPSIVNKQFKMLKELCTVGVARSKYSNGKLNDSEQKFMELDKRSRIWPSIIMDEAWLHFYMGNFNRTLGKIVTYNAPQLKFSAPSDFSPLAAYSYLKLCLYDDVLKIADKYYEDTSSQIKELNSIRLSPTQLDSEIGKSLKKHPSMFFYQESLKLAELEATKINRDSKLNHKKELIDNLQDFEEFQNKIISRQVRKLADKRIFDLKQTLEYLSYLKLEVLGKKKESLYRGEEWKGVRGDIKFLKRNNKQYFWDFAGEFWADELGDYVFALASECKK
ncbi:MAG: hypothetical protein QE271_06160 [Bacteriovoracaceae bacterium]|nr:hypothetical protein [Bacteriovoracaceae bacterium]